MTKKTEEGYTDEEWLQICQIEMNAHHNDGMTMKWYKEQYEETRKKIYEKNKDNDCDGTEGCC